MTKREAYLEIIESLVQSGYTQHKIVDALLHFDTHEPTQARVSLLSRGYGCKETEFLVKADVHHHSDLPSDQLEEYQRLFGIY